MLLRRLLHLAVQRRIPGNEKEPRLLPGAPSTREWEECAESLFMHRIAAPIWSVILRRGMQAQVPRKVAALLHRHHIQTARTNAEMMDVLEGMLERLRAAGIEPVLMKGAALLNLVYGDLGARVAQDVDLLVAGHSRDVVLDVFSSGGCSIRSRSADALVFLHETGVVFDVHHRFRLMDACDRDTLVQRTPAPFLAGRGITVFRPEPMLAALLAHLRGHLPSTGFFLAWILDIALLVDRWGAGMDGEWLQTLLGNDANRRLHGRVMTFLSQELGMPLSPALQPGDPSPGLPDLEAMNRSRRRALWGLSSPTGLLRLVAGGFARGRRHELPRVRPGDVIRWPLDAWREHRSTW